MTSAPKNRGRLTPTERLVNASLGGLMKQRLMVARHGKKHHGLKVEDTVKLTHVRLAPTLGTVITATSLATDLMVGRKESEGGLKRLVDKDLIVAIEKPGKKEVEYQNPEGYTYPPHLIDDMMELVADQVAEGPRLEKLVAQLDDPELRNRFLKAIAAAKRNTL